MERVVLQFAMPGFKHVGSVHLSMLVIPYVVDIVDGDKVVPDALEMDLGQIRSQLNVIVQIATPA